MWDNQGTEYSGVSPNTMPPDPARLYSELGSVAFRSTDGMDEKKSARFWAKVDRRGPRECWPWLGRRMERGGYGQTSIPGRRTRMAHRIAYELLVGEIPEGLTLDHLCRNPPCVNPGHMEPVSIVVNVRRGFAPVVIARRTGICMSGRHRIEGDNVVPGTGGRRECRVCRQEREAMYSRTKRFTRRSKRLDAGTQGGEK